MIRWSIIAGRSMFAKPTSGARRLTDVLRDRSGVIAIQTAVVATALVGITGLSVDVGSWYFTRRSMQTAADAAAVAGALELAAGHTAGEIAAAVDSDAAKNGFGPGGGTTVTPVVVNSPQSVSVTITKPADLFLSSMFLPNAQAPTISVIAQAGQINSGGPVCMLTLSSNAAGALTFNGNASISMPGCSMVNDSTSTTALIANGNVAVTTDSTCGPGGYRANGNATFSPTPSHCAAMADPLASLSPPSNADAPCDHSNLSFNGNTNTTLSPGVYCGGISFNGNSNVTFQAGTYILRNGGLTVNGNSNLTGNGVGFYLTGNGSRIALNGNGAVNLSAPTSPSDPMAGLIFFQDHATAADSVTNILNGNSNVRYEGTMYFGQQDVIINGNGNSNSLAPYTMMIANKVILNGNGTMTFNSNFDNSQVPRPSGMNLTRVGLMQ
jgi:Flp pilus assembly protein TadG